jgi:hypothetical protein
MAPVRHPKGSSVPRERLRWQGKVGRWLWSVVFWVVTTCSLKVVYIHFEGIYCLHSQGRRDSLPWRWIHTCSNGPLVQFPSEIRDVTCQKRRRIYERPKLWLALYCGPHLSSVKREMWRGGGLVMGQALASLICLVPVLAARWAACHMCEGRLGQRNTRKQRRICNEQLLYGNAGRKTEGGAGRDGVTKYVCVCVCAVWIIYYDFCCSSRSVRLGTVVHEYWCVLEVLVREHDQVLCFSGVL